MTWRSRGCGQHALLLEPCARLPARARLPAHPLVRLPAAARTNRCYGCRDRCGKWRNCPARGGRREDPARPDAFYCEWSNDNEYNSCEVAQEYPDGMIDMLLGHEIGYEGEGEGAAEAEAEAEEYAVAAAAVGCGLGRGSVGAAAAARAAGGVRRRSDADPSATTATGYKGVSVTATGRYEAHYHFAYKKINLGNFDSAVEAAAYARHFGPYTPPQVAEVDGVKLYLELEELDWVRGRDQNEGRFKVQAKRGADGKTAYLGRFDTAVDAAVAYARHGRVHPTAGG